MRVGIISIVVTVALLGVAVAQEEVVFKNYNLKHISLKDSEVRKNLETELRKVMSETGQFILDERSNTIIVRDSEVVHNEVAKLVATLDVGKPEETSETTITLRVSNVTATTAREAIEKAAEEDEDLRAVKISHSDKTAALILKGTPAQLEKAKAVVDALEQKFRAEVDTRVYKVHNRSAGSLAEIIKLHLAGAPGTGVVIDEITNTLIVRETRANHTRVQEVLREFDSSLVTLLLQFRVIYASREGTGTDESIKDIAKELKKMFDFTSYSAEEGPVVKVEQGRSAKFEDSASGMSVSLKRCDYDPESGKVRIEELHVSKKVDMGAEKPSVLTISTTIKVDSGHTVVIGGASSKKAKDALIVVVKATVEK